MYRAEHHITAKNQVLLRGNIGVSSPASLRFRVLRLALGALTPDFVHQLHLLTELAGRPTYARVVRSSVAPLSLRCRDVAPTGQRPQLAERARRSCHQRGNAAGSRPLDDEILHANQHSAAPAACKSNAEPQSPRRCASRCGACLLTVRFVVVQRFCPFEWKAKCPVG